MKLCDLGLGCRGLKLVRPIFDPVRPTLMASIKLNETAMKRIILTGLLTVPALLQSSVLKAESCTGTSPGWPYYNNGNNVNKRAQVCAWQTASGEASIGAGKTHTWYVDNNFDSSHFLDGCLWASSSAVSIISSGQLTSTRWSATATNTLTGSNTRHWSTGALWTNAEMEININHGEDLGYHDVATDWWGHHVEILWGNPTGNAQAGTDLLNHGDCHEDGTLQVYPEYWVSSNVNPNPTTASVASAAIQGTQLGVLPPQASTAKAGDSTNNPETQILNKEVTLPGTFAGGTVDELTLQCPKGYMPMTWDIFPIKDAPEARHKYRNGKIKFIVPVLGADATYKSQLVCRLSNGEHKAHSAHHLGSKGADRLETSEPGKHHLSGPGKDWIVATGDKSVVHAGLGNDHVEVGGVDSTATGGPGDDVIKAIGNASIFIEGGEGKDRLIGGNGPTFINAVDGSSRDVVVCNGTQNIVHIDKGDKVKGSCATVVVPN